MLCVFNEVICAGHQRPMTFQQGQTTAHSDAGRAAEAAQGYSSAYLPSPLGTEARGGLTSRSQESKHKTKPRNHSKTLLPFQIVHSAQGSAYAASPLSVYLGAVTP